MNQVNTAFLNIQYRPIKVGWCIQKNDTNSLIKAANLNFSLWGGIYNPIIPIDDPKFADNLINIFKVDVLYNADNSKEVKNFIEKYDYLPWPFDYEFIINKTFRGWQSILMDIEIPARSFSEEKNSSRVGLLEPLFRPALTLYNWDKTDNLNTLFNLIYGDLKKLHTNRDYIEILYHFFKIDEKEILNGTIIETNYRSDFTLLDLNTYNLYPDIFSRKNIPGFYIGDAQNTFDLINYWNLRAAKVPIYFYDYAYADKFEKIKGDVIDDILSHKYDIFRGLEKRVGLYFSGNTKLNNVDFGKDTLNINVSTEYWNGLNIKVPNYYLSSKFVYATKYPLTTNAKYSIQLPPKKFEVDSEWTGNHLICSVKAYSHYYDSDPFILSIPNIPELNTFIGESCALSWRDVRLGFDGIGKIIDLGKENLELFSVRLDELIIAMFKSYSINANNSKPGLIAKRILNQFEAFFGCRVFKVEGVRKLISSYKPDQSFKKSAALEKICNAELNTDNIKAFTNKYKSEFILGGAVRNISPDDLFNSLLEKNAFRVGLELDCPNCGLQFWLHIDSIKTFSECHYCGASFNITTQIRNRDWSYRRSGIFGLENNQEGAIPVVLTLLQLEMTIHSDIKLFYTSMTLESKNYNIKCETDFVFISQEFNNIPEVVIGECKSEGGIIEKKDVDNLIAVIEKLPSNRIRPYILFSKLSDFTDEEIDYCWQAQKNHDYRVIMLAKRELEPSRLYSKTYKVNPEINQYAHTLYQMAENTYKMYFRNKQ